jgi:hypothetical protein
MLKFGFGGIKRRASLLSLLVLTLLFNPIPKHRLPKKSGIPKLQIKFLLLSVAPSGRSQKGWALCAA